MGSFLVGATGTGNSFAAQGAPITQQGNLVQNIGTSQGQFNQNIAAQQALAGQLAAQAQGGGPNLADMQFQQALNQATKQNAGFVASQKGISPALAQRMASENQANMTQGAASQSAMMRAQQMLGAQQQLGGMYGQIGNQNLSQQSTLQNALAAQNNALVGMTTNQNNVNAGVAAQNAATAGGLAGGLLSGASSALGSMFAKGGMVPQKYADGGPVLSNWGFNDQPQVDSNQAASITGRYLTAGGDALKSGLSGMKAPNLGGGKSSQSLAGGPGDAMDNSGGASPGAGMAGDAALMAAAEGGKVPGHAEVKDDSYKNDNVPAVLSPGEIVIPRSITMHPNAAAMAAEFVKKELSKHKQKFADGGMAKPDFSQAAQLQDNGNGPVDTAVSNTMDSLGINQQPSQEQASVSNEPAPSNFDLGSRSTANQSPQQSFMPNQNEALAGVNQQIAGRQEQTKAEMAQQKAIEPLYGRHDQAMTQLLQQSQQNAFDHDAEVQNVIDDMKNNKIDPNSYMNNLSGGQKASYAIGMILGGLGQGLIGGKNPAMEYLQNQIQRDVQAQEMNMSRKKTLLGALEQQYGDKQQALKMTEAIYTAKMEDEIKQEMAKNGSPMAQAMGKQALGQLMDQRYQRQREVALMQAATQGMNSGDPNATISAMRILNPNMAKEMESRYVPGVGMAQIPVSEKQRGEIALRNELDQKLQKLEAFSKANSGTVMDRGTVARGKAIAQDVQDTYRRAQGQGVFREAEANFVQGMVNTDPTAFLAKYRVMPGYKAVKEGNSMALKNLYQSAGLKPPASMGFKPR